MGHLLREMHIYGAFLHISFRVPSPGTHPPRSLRIAPTKRDVWLTEPSFIHFSYFAVYRPSYRERRLFAEPAFAFPSGSTVKKSLLQFPLAELP
jgi:hypothetical protein